MKLEDLEKEDEDEESVEVKQEDPVASVIREYAT